MSDLRFCYICEKFINIDAEDIRSVFEEHYSTMVLDGKRLAHDLAGPEKSKRYLEELEAEKKPESQPIFSNPSDTTPTLAVPPAVPLPNDDAAEKFLNTILEEQT